MALRPPRRPTTSPRPAVRPAVFGVAGAGTVPQAAEVGSFDPAAVMEALQAQFETVLQEDAGVDAETRQFLERQFRAAISEAAQAPGDAGAEVPDRAAWMDAIQALQASGAVAEDEVNDLVRQINSALQPLERRESRIAIEFSRRLQTGSRDEALAWFRDEMAAASDDAAAAGEPAPLRETVVQLRGDAINSRSRSPRGPPPGK
jgi:hypothetical protein